MLLIAAAVAWWGYAKGFPGNVQMAHFAVHVHLLFIIAH